MKWVSVNAEIKTRIVFASSIFEKFTRNLRLKFLETTSEDARLDVPLVQQPICQRMGLGQPGPFFLLPNIPTCLYAVEKY
jgi:hypothetical protein